MILQDIVDWVAKTKLRRFDLVEDAVDEALSFYRVLCAKVPFEDLQVTSAEVPTLANIASYALSLWGTNIAGIVSARICYSTNQYRRLKRSHVRRFDMLSATAASRPTQYARWGQNIELFPAPSVATYTVRLRYWEKPTVVEADPATTVLQYPDEWSELHKYETLYRMYIHLEEHEKAMMLVQPAMLPRQPSPKRVVVSEVGIIPRLWNDLLMTVNQREAPDEDFGVNPMVRPYTWR